MVRVIAPQSVGSRNWIESVTLQVTYVCAVVLVQVLVTYDDMLSRIWGYTCVCTIYIHAYIYLVSYVYIYIYIYSSLVFYGREIGCLSFSLPLQYTPLPPLLQHPVFIHQSSPSGEHFARTRRRRIRYLTPFEKCANHARQ